MALQFLGNSGSSAAGHPTWQAAKTLGKIELKWWGHTARSAFWLVSIGSMIGIYHRFMGLIKNFQPTGHHLVVAPNRLNSSVIYGEALGTQLRLQHLGDLTPKLYGGYDSQKKSHVGPSHMN